MQITVLEAKSRTGEISCLVVTFPKESDPRSDAVNRLSSSSIFSRSIMFNLDDYLKNKNG